VYQRNAKTRTHTHTHTRTRTRTHTHTHSHTHTLESTERQVTFDGSERVDTDSCPNIIAIFDPATISTTISSHCMLFLAWLKDNARGQQKKPQTKKRANYFKNRKRVIFFLYIRTCYIKSKRSRVRTATTHSYSRYFHEALPP